MGELSGMAAALFSAIVLLLLLFLFTRYSLGAMRFTAVGRINLHLVPPCCSSACCSGSR